MTYHDFSLILHGRFSYISSERRNNCLALLLSYGMAEEIKYICLLAKVIK